MLKIIEAFSNPDLHYTSAAAFPSVVKDNSSPRYTADKLRYCSEGRGGLPPVCVTESCDVCKVQTSQAFVAFQSVQVWNVHLVEVNFQFSTTTYHADLIVECSYRAKLLSSTPLGAVFPYIALFAIRFSTLLTRLAVVPGTALIWGANMDKKNQSHASTIITWLLTANQKTVLLHNSYLRQPLIRQRYNRTQLYKVSE